MSSWPFVSDSTGSGFGYDARLAGVTDMPALDGPTVSFNAADELDNLQTLDLGLCKDNFGCGADPTAVFLQDATGLSRVHHGLDAYGEGSDVTWLGDGCGVGGATFTYPTLWRYG
jgi:hypothetical protein